MIIAFVGIVLLVLAIPAKRVSQTIRLADGTTQTVTLVGDEVFHYWKTSEGIPMRLNEDGIWERDMRDVETLHRIALERRNSSRRQLGERMRRAMRAVKAPFRAGEVTKKRGLLILVNFQDKKMVNGENSKDIYNQILNGQGNPYQKNFGSVREYFHSQSYGQFDIEFDVVGPVTLSGNMSYYGENDKSGYDKRAGLMIAEACKLADDQVNFADYDWDGDGEVENIYITYAGYSESSGGPANAIWPHQWELSDYSNYGRYLTLDGVKVDTYACGSELTGYSGNTLDGVGTMCHEYSHCLGLPDFYDTKGKSTNFGMSSWSIMDYGCYNGDGYTPAGYTAYERWYCGWLEPVELNEETKVSGMKNIEKNPEAYIIYNEDNRDEYYMLANHQKVEWDSKASGHGMMVLHVTYSKDAWENNTVNNITDQARMTIIPADNQLKTYKSNGSVYGVADSGDLWPGTSMKVELTDTSRPAAILYTPNTDGEKLMHKPITSIRESGGLISFEFSTIQELGIPLLSSPFTDIDSLGFTANWSPVENAVAYDLQYNEIKPSGDAELEIGTMHLITDIRATQYTLERLKPGYTYSVQVRAVGEMEQESKWSNTVKVTLPSSTTAVSTLRQQKQQPAVVIDMAGRKATLSRRGIYIVDGHKMIIK